MLFGQDGLPIPTESVIRRIGDLLHCGVFAMKLANNSVVVLVCESRLQLIMMPSEHQRIIWVLTNLLHKLDREVQGAGLGLTLSQTIVCSLGGRVGLESEMNEGSTFWFVLPLKATSEEINENK